jgi:manganese/zinc/iron transport system permease protein
MPCFTIVIALLLTLTCLASPAHAEPQSLSHTARVLLLTDYNTRVVIAGSTLLGVCSGVIGAFMLLRGRALLGDVVSHASWPGIALAFIGMELFWPGTGKSLVGLLIGAFVAGLFGVVCQVAIRRYSRVKEDAALAIVLSIFFGLGTALFTAIQNMPTGNAAGLHHFIYGKAASMIADDVKLIALASLLVLSLCGLLFKEFTLLSFDPKFGSAQGWPVFWLDMLLMILVSAVTVIGLQSVGLLLVVAMLITPSAAARFWTDRLSTMTLFSALFGGMAAYIGVTLSALLPQLATGAVIVLVGSGIFVVSMLAGSRRGVLLRMLSQSQLKHRIGQQDLMRAFYECIERRQSTASADLIELTRRPLAYEELLAHRTWRPSRLKRLLRRGESAGLLWQEESSNYRLTKSGESMALRSTRNHRLWEIYLITRADIAPSHVDRDADYIEHVLGPELMGTLETVLYEQHPKMIVPPDPHAELVSSETKA